LIGLEVQPAEWRNIGVVVDVIPAGNDLLEVKLNQQAAVAQMSNQINPVQKQSPKPVRKSKSQPKSPKPATVLIPFVKAIVLVDLKMVAWITPPVGLLDMDCAMLRGSSC